MNIRQRITLLIITAFLTLLVVGGFAVIRSFDSSREVKAVTEGVVPSAIESVELVTQLKDVHIATLNMVAAADKAAVAQTLGLLQERKKTLEQALQQQLVKADSQAQKGLVREAQDSLKNYFDAIETTAQFKAAGQDAMAAANMAATVDQYLAEQSGIIDTLQVEKRRSKDAAIDKMNTELQTTSSLLTVVTVLAVAGLAFMGVLLYRQIIFPINDMEHKMTEIASSQDFSHRVPINRMDEIGKSLSAFNLMVEKIQHSSDTVRQKTADMQAMLHNIPQGILTIMAGGEVHPEYSSYLETILETSDIAHRNAIDLLFAQSNIGSDGRAQIEATLAACIGEDEMNFAFNAHLLVNEMEWQAPSGSTKILDLRWSPIVNDNAQIDRVLLCVWDVTALRALEAEASAQKRELALIAEILAVSQEKFQSFMATSLDFMAENRGIIDALGATPSQAEVADAVTHLFRNLHTIKGNARTFGLVALTNAVHDAEQACDALRQDAALRWNGRERAADAQRIDALLETYRRINEDTLGRRGPGRRGTVEQYVMVKNVQVSEALQLLEEIDRARPDQLRDAVEKVRSRLRLLGTERLDQMLSGVLESLPSLAAELGKAVPMVSIAAGAYGVKAQICDTLRNVFMHLLRNAVDHGLETADQRRALGKPESGAIMIALDASDTGAELRLWDDGRGLALDKIRQRGLALGLIAEGENPADEDLAQLLFAPGFSTAEKVTQVSGRGVGMDAVKGFVEREGGTIALAFSRDASAVFPERGFRPFEIVIRLPAHCVVQG